MVDTNTCAEEPALQYSNILRKCFLFRLVIYKNAYLLMTQQITQILILKPKSLKMIIKDFKEIRADIISLLIKRLIELEM